jgi:DNA-damage-inducible protein J
VFTLAELTSLNIKINRNLKKQADMLFNEMGMTLTTAVNIFVRQAVQEQAIPFRIYVDSDRAVAIKAKEALSSMQEQAVANGIDKMSMDEIDAIISMTRQEKLKN